MSFIIQLDDFFEANANWYEPTDESIILLATAFGYVDLSNSENNFTASSNLEGGSIRLRITKLNRELKLISGEFESVCIDEDSGKTYSISQGKFEDFIYDSD